jgi:hypothetical protein
MADQIGGTDVTDMMERTEAEAREGGSPIDEVGATVRKAVDEARTNLPKAAAATQTAVDRMADRLDEQPELNLVAGMAFSVGMGLGLLIGGAPRVLALLGISPAIAFAFALAGRSAPKRASGTAKA